MPSISPSFLILGLVVASVTAIETSNGTAFPNASTEFGNYTTAATHLSTGNVERTTDTFTTISTSTSNITEGNSSISPSTTKQKGGDNSTNGNETLSTMSSTTSPKPIDPSKSTTSTTKLTVKSTTAKPVEQYSKSGDTIGIIILVVIILVAFGFGVACYFARKRGRRYSVDFTSRPDEANIPLSTVEPELPGDTVPQNGLQTFESTETTTKEPQEPEAKPEVQEEQKAEADKSASAESAAPAPSPDSSQDKPKEDVVAEPSPPAPVKLSVDGKTDDEGVISNETSVESLKETNENNSNNAGFSQKRDSKRNSIFWDVPLDCPV